MSVRLARAAAGATLLALVISHPVLAARLWSLTASPTTLAAGVAASVDLTFKNVGGSGGGDEMACVTVLVPSAFAISSVAIQSLPPGSANWMISTSAAAGGVLVTLREPQDDYPLRGDPFFEEAVVRVSGTAATVGSQTWQGSASDKPDCRTGVFADHSVVITVGGSTPTPPPPTAAPTPPPTAPPTPAPTAPPPPPPTAAPPPPPTAGPAPTATARPSSTPRPTAPPSSTPPPSTSPQATAPATSAPSPAAPNDATASPSVLASPSADGGLPTPRPSPLTGTSGQGQAGIPPSGGDAEDPPERPFDVPIPGGVAANYMTPLSFEESAFDWVVPGLVATTPGVFVILALLAQMVNAGLWLPMSRRRLNEPGARRRG